MVIGNCFSQFTPSNGVMSLLRVIKIGNFVVFLFYSTSAHIFPRNLICFCSRLDIFLFTVWYLFGEFWVVWHCCDRRTGIHGEVLIFVVDF